MNELIDFCLDTENPEKNYKLAQWYEKQNHTASAHVYYFRTAERTANENFAYTSLLRSSICYKSQGKRDATEKLLIHAALSFLPKRPEAYYLLSLFYQRKEEWDQCYLYADFGLKCYENEVDTIDLPEYQGKYALIYQKAIASWWWGKGEESKKLFQILKDEYWNIMIDEYKDLVDEKLFTFFKQESAKYSKETINVDNAILEKYTLDDKNLETIENEEQVVQIKPLYKNSSSKEEIVDFMQRSNFNLISEESNHPLLEDYEKRLIFKRKNNKFCFLNNSKSTSWIVDNFYDNPDEIRKFALEQEFGDESVITGFVGRRTFNQFLFPGLKEAFESVMGKKITKWQEHGMNGRFQICWSGERLVYHCDSQMWGGMIYLTPNAPYQCGTTLYADKKNRARTYYDPGWDEYWANTPGDCHLDRTPFEPVDVLGNVYNRLVIFDASCIHSASEYFGTNKENARLWQMFFFDTER